MKTVTNSDERVPMYGPHSGKCVINVPAAKVGEYEQRGFRLAEKSAKAEV